MKEKLRPPKLAENILFLFLRYEDSEHRLGDYRESFEYITQEKGYWNAVKWYWLQVIFSIPHFIINSIQWGGSMLSNYIKIALRNLYRTKLYSILNITGLGIAVALAIVGYVNYEFSYSFDAFHKDSDQIYSVNYSKMRNNKTVSWSYAPMPMAAEIKNNIPGVNNVTRMSIGSGTVKYGDNVFNEQFQFVDKEFFEIFNFPTSKGKSDALANKDGIVITEEIAEKYFGKENPIGKQLAVSPDGEKTFLFNVDGVIADPPKNSIFFLSVMISMERVFEIRDFDPYVWNHWARATFIKLDKNVLPKKIESQLQDFKQITNENNPDFQVDNFFMLPLKQIADKTRDLNGDPFNNGMHPAAIVAPSLMSLFVLLLACFNFVNTAIAFASKRLKEIGIRKVLGGVRPQLVWQFLTENIILCFLALVVGILLAEIFVPAYDSLWAYTDFSINYSENLGLVGFLVGLLLFTAIVAGGYPAFYISKFNPITIFSGNQKFGGTNPLIRVLLVFQFAISMTSLMGGIILYQNGEYISNMDLGFNREQILILPIRGENDFELIKSKMSNNPDILSIAGSRGLVGRNWDNLEIEADEMKMRMPFFEVGENYFETLDFTLIDGRTLDKDLKTDIGNKIIVNETFVNESGWDSPIGKFIRIKNSEETKELEIIGIAKDFHYNSVWRKIQPSAFILEKPENYRYASLKFDLNKIEEVSNYVQSEWKNLFPNIPYDGFYQNFIIEEAAQITNSIKLVFMYIAILVMITTGLGLFALVSLNIAKRSKEISIRKVLGASIANISSLISKEFVRLLLISSMLATVMAYYMVDSLLSSIWDYYVTIGAFPFIVATLLMIILALISISSQLFAVVKTNPIDKLRTE